MAAIDSLLSLVDRQGANELRLGTDRDPQMFADGAQKRLAIPKTDAEALGSLLGELLSAERVATLAAAGRVEAMHEVPGLGPFRVTLTRRGPAGSTALDAVFLRGRGKAAAPPPPTTTTAHAHEPLVSHGAPITHEPHATHDAPATSFEAEAPSPLAPAPTLAVPPGLERLLRRATALGASDVHLRDGAAPRLRVHGALRPADEGAVDLAGLLGPLLSPPVRARLATLASVDLAIGVEGVGRFRVHVYATSTGLAAAVRLLAAAPPTLAELRHPLPLVELVDQPHGLVLVTGATGSGKTSTLAALATEALHRHARVLVTLEDPIEYDLGAGTSGGAPRGMVVQRQVGRDVKDFASGLRDALREDPDMLLIGEMRDAETVSLALTAAETGHLVLASLHSRSAASAIERIVDTYPAERAHQVRAQLADSLRAVVAQRLLPRASGEGRVVATEVLRVNHAVAGAIREGKTGGVQSAMQAGKKDGMLPLERCLADLVHRRAVTLDAARAAANDAGALASYLAGGAAGG